MSYTLPSSPLTKLDPYTDSNSLVRVGRRLNLSDVLGQVIHKSNCSVRNMLATLIQTKGSQLNEETIVNSCLLTIDSLNDPTSLNQLMPDNLLTIKTKVLLPPPGVFQPPDMSCRTRGRLVQNLANAFCITWKKEYLLNLQQRQKWSKPRQNMCVGDVVLIKDDKNLPPKSMAALSSD